MPLFDFVCETDKEVVKDVILRTTHTKDDYPVCPKCGVAMSKEIGRTHAHFKGAGFHSTDYRAPTRGY